MSNSWESVKEDAGYLAGGAAIYYGLVWIFLCFPAFIIGMCVSRMVYGIDVGEMGSDGDKTACFFLCLGVMVVVSVVIFILAWFEKWLILIMLYALTAWPFINILLHFWNSEDDSLLFPLPLDFWPFW